MYSSLHLLIVGSICGEIQFGVIFVLPFPPSPALPTGEEYIYPPFPKCLFSIKKKWLKIILVQKMVQKIVQQSNGLRVQGSSPYLTLCLILPHSNCAWFWFLKAYRGFQRMKIWMIIAVMNSTYVRQWWKPLKPEKRNLFFSLLLVITMGVRDLHNSYPRVIAV